MANKPARNMRKVWSEESMKAAVKFVEDGGGLRESSRLYNVPVETLRRRVNGTVSIDCRPGPATVLTEEEEECLANYLIQMSEMGFGLPPDAVKNIAYRIVEKSNRKHPFTNNTAGQDWFKGFCRRHPKLTIRRPQPLSYCRAVSANRETIDCFFGKLGSLYGRLNLISKPMNIYNVDESGVTIVHKPGRVVAELGHRNVYAVTSAERGKTHTVLACVSASGCALPPLIVYPRKTAVPDKLKKDAMPGTICCNSENGWINQDIYMNWFELFMKMIPSSRPVLLIQDGHGSHISIEFIELARANDIHVLCLPAHTTHILQPLDVGVFKSLKSNFNKACHKYIADHPGRVITTDMIASLIGAVWPQACTPINIMSGFRKCGIFPINPGAVDDRQLEPSKACCREQTPTEVTTRTDTSDTVLFSQEEHQLYQKYHEEGYDIDNPSYIAWLKIYHPTEVVSAPSSETSSLPSQACTRLTSDSKQSTRTCSDELSDILVIPKPKVPSSSRRKKGLNSKAVCITDDEVLEVLKAQKQEKLEKEENKKAKRLEREEKRKAKELEKQEKKRQNEEKKLQKEIQKRQKEKQKEKTVKNVRRGIRTMRNRVASLNIKDDDSIETDEDVDKEDSNENSEDEPSCSENKEEADYAKCPKCGLCFEDDDTGLWICCDTCDQWYDFKCTTIRSKNRIPKFYFCDMCVS